MKDEEKRPHFKPTLIEGIVIAAILAVVITTPILMWACSGVNAG